MAPKKQAVNSKAEEAKARKEQVKAEKSAKEAKEKEDARWADEGKGGKAAKKKADEERKKQEQAQKKAEVERLKREEEQEMAQLSKKGVRGAKSPEGAGASKVTKAELDRMKEEEEKKKAEAARQRKKEAARVQDEAEYERQVNVANTNRMEKVVDARNLDEAVCQLSAVVLEEQTSLDKHPEKRLRAAFKAYEEAELPRLRQETPGLTLTQYKEQIWKSWKKAPQNPLNQMPPR